MAGLPANDSEGQSTQKLKLGSRPAPRRAGKTLFARKGEALPLVDKKGGAEAPEEVVVETRATRLREVDGDFDTSLQIINERSAEAGYPDNPTPDGAETQYFEVADIYAGAEAAYSAPQLEAKAETPYTAPLLPAAAPAVVRETPPRDASAAKSDSIEQAIKRSATKPDRQTTQAPKQSAGRRARIAIQMTAAEYLRLKLGAAVLGFDEAELINTALTEYLDNWGVDSLADCAKLKGAVELFESSAPDDE